MGALFIAQATNTHLTFGQEVAVLLVSLLTSKGNAAVVGSAFITLTATLSSMGTIPVEGMILVLGVDWFMAQARAMTNMVGAGVATVVIARWENEFDQARALAVLNGDDIGPSPAESSLSHINIPNRETEQGPGEGQRPPKKCVLPDPAHVDQDHPQSVKSVYQEE